MKTKKLEYGSKGVIGEHGVVESCSEEVFSIFELRFLIGGEEEFTFDEKAGWEVGLSGQRRVGKRSKPEPCSRKLIFHVIWLVNAGRFSTALQLGKGLRIFPHSPFHQSRSRGGTASLIVVFPLGWLMIPAVTNNQKRRL